MFDNQLLLAEPGRYLISGAPEGSDARTIALLAADEAVPPVLHVARDDARMAEIAETVRFFAPDISILRFPAWDCLPYDRVSPNPEIQAERIATLAALSSGETPALLLTTVNALLQRVPTRETIANAALELEIGNQVDLDDLTGFLARNGYERASTVREPGEYAVRGGIVDLFPPDTGDPVRLDFFGDELEGLRTFDPATQRTLDKLDRLSLRPVGEVILDQDAIARFRSGYREVFGPMTEDPLYVAISEGRKQIGMEHWLPLFHDGLETLFDYLPDAVLTQDAQVEDARAARLESIADYHDARLTFLEAQKSAPAGTVDNVPPYRPIPPDRLFLDEKGWTACLEGRVVAEFTPFRNPEGIGREVYAGTVDLGARRALDFAAARAKAAAENREEANVFDTVRDHLTAEIGKGRRAVVTAFTRGSAERLRQLLIDHGIDAAEIADHWIDVVGLPETATALAVLPLDHGFADDHTLFLSEQDILGDRLVRPQRKKRRAEDFIADAGELTPGDHVVHLDHGIGRYDGLETVVVSGAPHDCLQLTYAGDDRLFVPVENIEVLSRYGSADTAAQLDRLGGAAWQAKKSKLRQRLRDIADELIRIAAARSTKSAPSVAVPEGLYQEFCAGFPYAETDDQIDAIHETLGDLEAGRPMDRLICGDVGFGKTEIALRAALSVVAAGGQVAVVTPTTLLCRQHFRTFSERFRDLPVRVEQLSRLVTPKTAGEIKEGLASGEVDIVVGTHALLGKSVSFKNLVLLIVDEEQHFGVAHKERLKALRMDVHVLTLTATPIPRTLQMALTGVKDLSLIATPPVDRLAVRTFVTPYDPVVIREALMREHFRGGQSFYVCPRIQDLDGVAAALRELVPEIRIGMAHGRMPIRQLEDVMNAFYDGEIDLLLSTQIVESGLDIPRANTLIIHRADMFGLAQLYQLRGRIGRSKLRAYCYLTLPTDKSLTATAEKRLEVMQSLDTLGAGFTLASHDLDIRGAGNLLGEEQSGHIKVVGVELYQHMLEEAVAQAKGETDADTDEDWVPQINLGLPVLIPEPYVEDLDVRLGLYRRIADIQTIEDREAFAAELIDRFGPLPEEVETLLRLVSIKRHCKAASIEKIDAGPKGATLSFHDNDFPNPPGLIEFISADVGQTKLRPDHKLVYRRDWSSPKQRLRGAEALAAKLAEVAGQA